MLALRHRQSLHHLPTAALHRHGHGTCCRSNTVSPPVTSFVKPMMPAVVVELPRGHKRGKVANGHLLPRRHPADEHVSPLEGGWSRSYNSIGLSQGVGDSISQWTLPSRSRVSHPTRWQKTHDAVHGMSCRQNELHREIDAWLAAAAPVASEWLPETSPRG
jgi:hypothetical protein